MRARVGAVAILLGIATLFAAPAAGAHALLQSSVPAAGAQLDGAPAAVTIVFTEAPEPSLTLIHVLDTSGGSWEKGRPHKVPGQPKALSVAVKPLPTGTYTVSWRAVSRVDGHATAGAFAFGVGVPAGPTAGTGGVVAPTSPPPSALEIVGRWTLFLGFSGLIGCAWVGAAGFGGSPAKALGRLSADAWVLSAVGIGLLAGAQVRASGTTFSGLLGTPLGHALVWRAVAVAVAGLALIVGARTTGRARRVSRWVCVLATLGGILAHVSAGHAAARSFAAGEIAAQWVHVAAAAVWIGGLAALLVGIHGAPAPEKTFAVRRFSTVAGFALAAVVATGVVRALAQVDSWHALFDSGYGLLVVAKAALIVPLAALGGINRYRNVPRCDDSLGGLRKITRGELAIAAGVFAVAALLASFAPPAPSQARAATESVVVVSGADFGTTVRVRLTASPGTAGPNTFIDRITDFDTGTPITAQRVSLRFTFLDDPSVGSSTLVLARQGNGSYTGQGSNLSLVGRWRVTTVIERGAGSVEVPLMVATPCVTRAQPAPGQPTIYVIDIPGVGTAQGYVDPGRAGLNEVHVTFFDPSGNELPVAGPVTMRASLGDRLTTFAVRRFGVGHFIADGTLKAATWRFDFAAVNRTRTLRGCFNDAVVAK
jgi:copper transport protein